jgi:hypothetical protein
VSRRRDPHSCEDQPPSAGRRRPRGLVPHSGAGVKGEHPRAPRNVNQEHVDTMSKETSGALQLISSQPFPSQWIVTRTSGPRHVPGISVFHGGFTCGSDVTRRLRLVLEHPATGASRAGGPIDSTPGHFCATILLDNRPDRV